VPKPPDAWYASCVKLLTSSLTHSVEKNPTRRLDVDFMYLFTTGLPQCMAGRRLGLTTTCVLHCDAQIFTIIGAAQTWQYKFVVYAPCAIWSGPDGQRKPFDNTILRSREFSRIKYATYSAFGRVQIFYILQFSHPILSRCTFTLVQNFGDVNTNL